jgi:hypothetical protein
MRKPACEPHALPSRALREESWNHDANKIDKEMPNHVRQQIALLLIEHRQNRTGDQRDQPSSDYGSAGE